MCSGRVDPQFVLQAHRLGADGVLILACHTGDCHYKKEITARSSGTVFSSSP
jgi:F420-non-reducing hydrogenase iron-sulfur subunit